MVHLLSGAVCRIMNAAIPSGAQTERRWGHPRHDVVGPRAGEVLAWPRASPAVLLVGLSSLSVFRLSLRAGFTFQAKTLPQGLHLGRGQAHQVSIWAEPAGR